jgi:hypothetical protein
MGNIVAGCKEQLPGLRLSVKLYEKGGVHVNPNINAACSGEPWECETGPA